MRLALFDLDHTLLPLDSDHGWGQYTVRIGWRDAQDFAARNEAFYRDYQAGRLDIHAYIRFATEAMREHGQQASEAAREGFMAEVIRPAIQPQALDLVRRHQDAGDQVIIITATNEFVTRPVASAFGVDELLAVQLERGAEAGQWLTGNIVGTPSFREGKITRLEQWLAERQLGWDDVAHSVFYSDSMNDFPLLEKVDQAVAVNPDSRLRELATARGWTIRDLFA